MHPCEILDRLEAILEDDFWRDVPPSLRDELDSFFDVCDLEKFKVAVAEEFDVVADNVFSDVVDFRDLVMALVSAHNP